MPDWSCVGTAQSIPQAARARPRTMRAVARARSRCRGTNLGDTLGVRQPVGASVSAQLAEPRDHGLGQPRFHLAVADAAFAVPPFDLGELARGREEPVQVEQRASVRVLGGLDRRAVGDDLLDFFLDRRGVVEDVDRVVVALGHLAAVQPGHHGHGLEDVRLGQPEDVFAAAEDAVEPLGDVAGDFQVLLLVLARPGPGRRRRARCRPLAVPGRRRGRARRTVPAGSCPCS